VNIITAFEINLTLPELVCFIGAGGKTTTMFALAQALKSLHKRILVTTTTNIIYPEKHECDAVIVNDEPDPGLFQAVSAGTVTVLGHAIVNGEKLAGVNKAFIHKLHQQKLFDCILVECDGSKRKPIKAAAYYEPVVPANTTKTIGVIGLDAMGKPIAEEYVHRPEQFCAVVNRCMGEMIDPEAVVNLIVSPQGLFKGVPEGCAKYVLLNKADNAQLKENAGAILTGLLKRDAIPVDCCIIGSLAKGRIYP
jgi:probable selenium-dependent hydroxylase accessory protein YqeC